MKSRYENIQRMLGKIGDYGCFFLSLLSIAEEYLDRRVDLVDTVRIALDRKWTQADYTVLDDCALLSYLTGKKVTKRCESSVGVVKLNEYTIAKWYNPATNYKHFRRRGWDVYDNSVTVRDGYIMCYYVYTIG